MSDELNGDLLVGAASIAEFMFGDRTERRKIYYLAAKGDIPCFRLGSILYARKSTLVAAIAKLETGNIERIHCR